MMRWGAVVVLAGVLMWVYVFRTLAGDGTEPPLSPDEATATASTTASAAPIASATAEAGVYVVNPGDSLALIAQRNGVTVQQLLAANPEITDPNSLAAGQRIRIPR